MPASEAGAPSEGTVVTNPQENALPSTSTLEVKDTAPKASSPEWIESIAELFSSSTLPSAQKEVTSPPKLPTPPPIEPSSKATALESFQTRPNPKFIDDSPIDPVTDVFKSLFGFGRNETSSTDETTKPSPPINALQAVRAKTSADQKTAKQEALKKPEPLVPAKELTEPVSDTFKSLFRLSREETKSTYKKGKDDLKKTNTPVAAKVKQNIAVTSTAKVTADKQKEQKSATLRLEQPKRRGEKKAKAVPKATVKEKQAKAVLEAKPGATIRLFDFFVGREEEEEEGNQRPSAEPPKGVPVLSKWKRNIDGSVSGIITGSKTFNDGEAITTSPLKGEVIPGSVVVTQSGSR